MSNPMWVGEKRVKSNWAIKIGLILARNKIMSHEVIKLKFEKQNKLQVFWATLSSYT